MKKKTDVKRRREKSVKAITQKAAELRNIFGNKGVCRADVTDHGKQFGRSGQR